MVFNSNAISVCEQNMQHIPLSHMIFLFYFGDGK